MTNDSAWHGYSSNTVITCRRCHKAIHFSDTFIVYPNGSTICEHCDFLEKDEASE